MNIIKGDVIYSKNQNEICCIPNGYLIFEETIVGAYKQIPEQYQSMPIQDYSGKLIVPGLIDLHTHAPQYPFRGTGMDLELLPWLETYAFAEESNYQNMDYAKQAYIQYADALKHSTTTRACIFATIHKEATQFLMDILEESGMCGYVGKVNMDRNAPEILCEQTEISLQQTKSFLEESKHKRIRPILTPRFVPSCSGTLMQSLGKLSERYHVPVQSHLSENLSEIAWVAQLHPACNSYADVYEQYGLFGKKQNCVMAHCVYSDQNQKEYELLKKRNVWIAHCPDSNINLSSGIAPAAKFLRSGLRVGLGSDVAGGTKLSICAAMADAIKVSKLRTIYVEKDITPLTVAEAFYMATKCGGAFFGNVGSFETGYEADILVIDDTHTHKGTWRLEERLEKWIYLSECCELKAKYVQGKQII